MCLREPSLGPCFGMKGGAAGGGYAQVVPMTDINLHFTGDFHAIGAAHNLLSAIIDNHMHWENQLNIDPRRVSWRRVVDMNDRALRTITSGLGGFHNGVVREAGFDITVASEIMAIFCLANDLEDLRERIGNITIGHTRDVKPVQARALQAEGALTALLRDALQPNLVQTLENNPALMHGGPFANIAHGCNSVIATKAGLKLADYVVTEAGFGADLGAEKFFDIKCRKAGLHPDAVVLVIGQFGVPVTVAINHYVTDTDAEHQAIKDYCAEFNVSCTVSSRTNPNSVHCTKTSYLYGRKYGASHARFMVPMTFLRTKRSASNLRISKRKVTGTTRSAWPKHSTVSQLTRTCLVRHPVTMYRLGRSGSQQAQNLSS